MKHSIAFLLISVLFSMPIQSQVDKNYDTPTATIFQQAIESIAVYQFEDALKLLSECYIRDQKNIAYINRIAYCHSQLGRYPDAKTYYNEALRFDSINITAISALGSLYEQERNYRKALSYYEHLLQLDSTNSFYYKRAAYLYSKTGDMFTGIEAFLKAHQLNARDVEVIDQLSKIYLQTDNPEYAEQMLKKGLYLDPNNIKLLHLKARLYQKREEHKGVIESVNQTLMQGDTTDYYQMILGVAYLQLDSLTQGIYHLEELVKRKKDSEHTHHYLGVAYHKKDSLERSIKHFQIAIDKGTSGKLDIYYSDLGSIFEEQNDHKVAIEHYEKAYEYSESPVFLFHLARNHDLYYKDKKMAMRYYQKYWQSGDRQYRNYTEDRMEKLKEVLHFQR